MKNALAGWLPAPEDYPDFWSFASAIFRVVAEDVYHADWVLSRLGGNIYLGLAVLAVAFVLVTVWALRMRLRGHRLLAIVGFIVGEEVISGLAITMGFLKIEADPRLLVPVGLAVMVSTGTLLLGMQAAKRRRAY